LALWVISEIHYHPRAGDEGLEFVELTNDHYSPEDISGWALVDGVRFVFPSGTILRAREILVVCTNADAVQSAYGIDNAIGNFEGRLNSAGERVTLVNHAGAEMASVRYNDRGKWPTAADGSGHSLVLISLYQDTSEPENWQANSELGGSPGIRNFSDDRVGGGDEPIAPLGADWHFRRGTEPFGDPDATTPLTWTLPEFDDASWETGPSGFGFGTIDDLATVIEGMRSNYSSVALRLRFALSEEDLTNGEVLLRLRYDDGFCAYINGIDFASGTCPTEVVWDAVATRSHDATRRSETVFAVPSEHLVVGENVLAIAAYNRSTGSNDFALIPVLALRSTLSDKEADDSVHLNKLMRGTETEAGWVELYNESFQPRDLSGWSLNDEPSAVGTFVFGAATTVAPRGFLVVTETESGLALSGESVQLFLKAPSGETSNAATFDRPPLPTLAGGAEARFPDGSHRSWITSTPTPGAPNQVPHNDDIVLNEIFYNPPEAREGEFIELYHRCTGARDLTGYHFTNGIDYEFPDGTVALPGTYIVVAADPQLVGDRYGLSGVLGPSNGRLSNSGENLRLEDSLGNLVDEVSYKDGGDWPNWADAGGSSLELIDAQQDNDFALAWEASDETAKAEWEEHRFGTEAHPAILEPETELHLFLVDKGVCHVDDLSLSSDARQEFRLIVIETEWAYAKGTEPFSEKPLE
jgi:hypothetical protein